MHRLIYRAIRERSVEAARTAMRNHLLLAQKAQAEEVTEGFGEIANGSGSKTDDAGKNPSMN